MHRIILDKNPNTMIKKHIRFLILTAAMSLAGGSAWATTYYLYGGNSNTVSSWSTTPLCTSESLSSFSITSSGMLSSGWHYFGVSTNRTGYSQGGTSKQILVEYNISKSGSHISSVGAERINASSNCIYGVGKYQLSETISGLTIALTANGTFGTCETTFTKYGFSITESTSYTISTSGSNCTFSPTNRSIASGSSNTFTVTPASGYKLVSASVTNATCSPTDLNNATVATTITVSNPTAAGTLTVVTAPATSTSVPTVRIGSQIEEEADYDVHLGGYVAATGCSDITKFTIYYSKSTIASKSGSGVFTKEISVSSPGIGSNTPLTLPASEIATHNWGNANMYVRITATNGVGESELSDEVILAYTLCEGVITELTISPASKAVEINKAQTFSYTANTGAVVNSVKWYNNDAEVGTGSTYTFTPTTTSNFTIGLKAVNTSCNPAPGFAAETQTYTVCSPITGVTINDCPVEQAVGEEITLHATITGATSADSWVWRVNDAAQEVTVDGTSASITFTPREAKEYESVLTVTDCVGQEHVTSCTFNAAAHFTANNITGKSFTACKDNHQFKFSEMFSPLPDSWSVVVKNTTTDAKSLFSLDENGNMVWNPSGKSSGTYSYVFTGVKSGYTNATAELSFTFTANAPSATLSDITITSGSTPTYPYTKVELHCDVASGSASDIGWSVNNGGLVVRTSKGYAYFKGKAVKTATTYTVSAVGLSESCGATAAKTINIVVNPEPTESCD